MPHHRPLDRPAERCCICDEPTFRAGPSDDSLYGDKMDGPYCDKCYEPVRERDEAVRHHDTLVKAVDEYEAERQRLMEQHDALLSALRDAVTIMHTARKSNWHEHDGALARFELDHPAALDLLEDSS